MTDVSIIIPTFNRLWCLPEAVASCRKAGTRMEIIVVDDGSTDGTWDWLRTQPDVTALRHELNCGKMHSVNDGMALATGEFVRFLDSDDLLPPDVNSVQCEQARKTGADLVAAGYVARYEATQLDHVKPWTWCSDFIAQQIGECDSSHYSAIFSGSHFSKVSFIVRNMPSGMIACS